MGNFCVPLDGALPFTDYSRWRFVPEVGGRHTWRYLKDGEELEYIEQKEVDKYWLGIPLVRLTLQFHPVQTDITKGPS